MKDFITSTAWLAENPPQPYGLFHLLITFIGVPLAAFVAYKIKRMDHQKADRMFFYIGIYLSIAEVYKQFFHYYCVSSNVFGVFPGYLCSLPMYICLLFPLIKNKKPYLYFMELFNFLGGFLAFAEPSGILDSYWNNTIHSVSWHLILVFLGFYIMFSGRGAKTKDDYLAAVKVFLCLCVVSLIINLLLYKVSSGEVNCLYMGPGRNNIIVYSTIYDRFGAVVCTPIWVSTLCIGAFIVFWIIQKIHKLSGGHYVGENME